jgi:branched-chain amino acid transport system ATP-binding protein
MANEGKEKDPVLVCDQLSAGWKETQVLDQISFQVAAGETLVVLGRNGVGKSTLLSTIAGRADHKSGRIMFQGRQIDSAPSHVRARLGIGFIPQEREIFPSLSVEENLAVAARPGFSNGDLNSSWNRERIYELFPRLAERRKNGGQQLSGGEQQMLSIGRALMGNPSLLLMDEPLEGLAPVIVDYLVDAIHRIRRETAIAILIVEQHVDIALEFSDDVIVLDRGEIVYKTEQSESKPDRLLIQGFIEIGA